MTESAAAVAAGNPGSSDKASTAANEPATLGREAADLGGPGRASRRRASRGHRKAPSVMTVEGSKATRCRCTHLTAPTGRGATGTGAPPRERDARLSSSGTAAAAGHRRAMCPI